MLQFFVVLLLPGKLHNSANSYASLNVQLHVSKKLKLNCIAIAYSKEILTYICIHLKHVCAVKIWCKVWVTMKFLKILRVFGRLRPRVWVDSGARFLLIKKFQCFSKPNFKVYKAQNWPILGKFYVKKILFTNLVSKMMCCPDSDMLPLEPAAEPGWYH